jgi:hypothetical protein
MELPTLQIRKVREDIICITGGLTYEDIGCYVQRKTKGQTHFCSTFLIKSLGGGSGEAFVPCGA